MPILYLTTRQCQVLKDLVEDYEPKRTNLLNALNEAIASPETDTHDTLFALDVHHDTAPDKVEKDRVWELSQRLQRAGARSANDGEQIASDRVDEPR